MANPNFNGIELQKNIEDFLNDRRAQDLSPNTIIFYQDRLNKFKNWCVENKIFEVLDITPVIIRNFLLYLKEKGHNAGGVHSYYRTLKAFLFFYENEFEPDNWKNPIRKVKPPKVIVEPIEGISLDNFYRLLEACDKTTERGQRNKTILLILLETGVRARELLQINIEDIDFTDSSILIRMGKGRKPRNVFMGSTARRNLRKHLRNMHESKGALFTTIGGDRLTYSGLRQIINHLSIKAGIPEQSIHDFRRTFCLEQLKRGVDLVTLARLMGHTSLSVLSRYLKQTKGDIGKTYQSIIN